MSSPDFVAPPLSRTLVRALLWVVIAFFAGTFGAFAVGFVCGLLNGARLAVVSPANLQAATFVGALVCAAFAFHRGALREAGRSPHPLIHASVHPSGIRRWPVLVGACLVLTPFGVLLAAALVSISESLQQMTLATNPLLLVIAWALVATVTPLAEETFFRGWLWSALELRKGALVAALVSGSLFLFAHMTEALLRGQLAGAVARGVVLAPLAIGLSIVRDACGTPRASMIVHGLYNLAVVAAPSVLLAAGLLAR